jgi:hypothetical protein
MAMAYMIWQEMCGNGVQIGIAMITILRELLIKYGQTLSALLIVLIPMNPVFLRKYSGADHFYVPINTAPDIWWVPGAKPIGELPPTMPDSGV